MFFMNVYSLSLQSLASKEYSLNKPPPSFVLVSSDTQSTKEIKDQISKIPLVSEVIVVGGMYDLVIKIESESSNEIKDVIANKIRNVEGVRTCLSLFGIDPNYPVKKGSKK